MSYIGFDALAKEVGSPALAAAIGRKKYGAPAMQQAAASGTSLKGAKVKKKRPQKVRPKY